jgi:hypothetical protein
MVSIKTRIPSQLLYTSRLSFGCAPSQWRSPDSSIWFCIPIPTQNLIMMNEKESFAHRNGPQASAEEYSRYTSLLLWMILRWRRIWLNCKLDILVTTKTEKTVGCKGSIRKEYHSKLSFNLLLILILSTTPLSHPQQPTANSQ